MTERFELLEEAGRGAMGVVYRARDNTTGKIVAIKMLRDVHADDPEYVTRFAHEVDLARQVRSPNIVRIRGYGARDGSPFVVLEFVEGQSLRAYLAQNGPLQPELARNLLGQIAQALAAVHAAGIVHRDVKASNVLLTRDGVAKLTDFGIAHGGDARGPTRKGALIGTPAYMAPEGSVDARSDLYSLGVVYYELLCGALPFTSTNYQEVILAHMNKPPDLERLPASERGLAGWLLAKDPAKRPGSAAALLSALHGNGPVMPRPAVTPKPKPPVAPRPAPAPRPLVSDFSRYRTAGEPNPTPSSSYVASTGYRPAPSAPPAPPVLTQPARGPGGIGAAVIVGLLSLVFLVAVVAIAASSNGPSPALQAQSDADLSGLLIVGVIGIGALAIAVAATMAMSRTRRR